MQLNLGQKIRELRQRDGRTQETLAEAIGVTSQAVSRWEANGGYPDMEMIPSIAHYFGVSIDELFGYNNERSQKINMLVEKIENMNFQNNGVDINIGECISFARNALIEFPGNEKIMLCLASVLYNAGYVRYGEHHLSDSEGYDILDTERHRTYSEWKEAISLYEKLLKTMEDGEPRHRVIRELTQLYLNIGEQAKALAVIETAPDIYGSREILKAKATDGKERAKAYGEALLKTVMACSELMPEEQFLAFLIAAFTRMHEVMKPGTPFYIWHAETVGGAFRRATNEALGKVRQMLVWNKNAFTMGHQDYQWKHEACIYGWTDGGSHYFVDDRTQATVIEDKRIDINKLKKEEMRELLRDIFSDKVSTTVIDENKPARNADHPTMKPLKLLARLIKNSSRQDDIVLDTFGGSGSTLITCEQLGRSCYTMELDPKYADVIVKRWLKFTGADHAELVRGGKKQPVTTNML